MKSGSHIGRLIVLAATLLPAAVQAQENSAKRLSSIVGVAVEEYRKAIDNDGKLISQDEYTETSSFLTDARSVATRLSGYSARSTQAVLDTLIAAVKAKRPPQEVQLIEARFKGALGIAGALDLPTGPLDTARGHALFTSNCASCHGERGRGDGVAHGPRGVVRVGPLRDHEQHRGVLGCGQQLLGQLQRRLVGPMDVLENDHDRALGGQPLEQMADDLERAVLQRLR